MPEEKVARLRALIGVALGSWKITFKDLQILVGHLNFTCKVTVPGRAFCRLYMAMLGFGGWIITIG